MYYGDEKNLQMSRSILPCTNRKNIRKEKARISRKLRRKVRQQLKQIHCEDDFYEENPDFDWKDNASIERSYLISKRREYNKINSFIKWAKKKAEDRPCGSKMSYIESILPGRSIIRKSSLNHLSYVKGFCKNPLKEALWLNFQRKKEYISDSEMESHLHRIVLDNKLHKMLNDLLKLASNHTKWRYTYKETDPISREDFWFDAYIFWPEKPILLLGLKDIKPFMQRIRNNCKKRFIIKPKRYEYCNNILFKATKRRHVYWKSCLQNSKKIYLHNFDYHPEYRKALNVFVKACIKYEYKISNDFLFDMKEDMFIAEKRNANYYLNLIWK